jgi:hypothetical protein
MSWPVEAHVSPGGDDLLRAFAGEHVGLIHHIAAEANELLA